MAEDLSLAYTVQIMTVLEAYTSNVVVTISRHIEAKFPADDMRFCNNSGTQNCSNFPELNSRQHDQSGNVMPESEADLANALFGYPSISTNCQLLPGMAIRKLHEHNAN